MTRPWLQNYPAGVPAEIDAGQYRSVVALMEESFERYADQAAYTCMGRTLSYRQLDRKSRDLAAWLQRQGLERGDRVAIMLPNILQYPIAVAAVLRAGFVVVNVNPLYTARELAHQLKDSGAKAIILLENFALTLEQVLSDTAVETVVLTGVGDQLGAVKGKLVNAAVKHVKKMVPVHGLRRYTRFNRALRRGFLFPLERPLLAPDDLAVLQYTGGTTGVSKGAMLLHRTLIANVLASEAWMQPGLRRKLVTGPINVVCALPLYHVYAFVTCSLVGMRAGGHNLLIPNPRDMDATISALKPYKLHMFPAVNTLFQGLLNHPRFSELDFSELMVCNGGGMAVQKQVAQNWLEATGCPIVEGYGLSETSSGVTCNRTDSTRFTGTVGLPLPNVSVHILHEDGYPLPAGEVGEIAIKGPQVMAGYWQRPDETAQVMTANGYFKSGDIGVMNEDGFIRIVDRKKDMILVSGFNVYPNEIEDVVVTHPGVLECAVVGVPDAKSGEAVKLFVVKKDVALTEADIHAHCATQLTGYKRPKHVEFRSDLPKSNVGKILRRELRSA